MQHREEIARIKVNDCNVSVLGVLAAQKSTTQKRKEKNEMR
jgi:hypothetical protein